jgi:Icc-related predicted phosphoesterase
MVKFQIASDLHIEYKNDALINDIASYITPSADVLILAGDIGNLYKYEQLKDFLLRLSPSFEYILYVPGNHEYYRAPGHPEVTMTRLYDRLLLIEEEIPNLYVLNRGSVCVDDVCIVGCTLWSHAKTQVPPFIVRINGMNQTMYNNMHAKDRKHIMKMMKYCKEKRKKMLVVTHHCPTYKVVKGKKATDKYVSLYASDLDNLLRGDYVHTWVCGHLHRNFDFTTTLGTRLVSNQLGKPKDAIADFRTNMVIEV